MGEQCSRYSEWSEGPAKSRAVLSQMMGICHNAGMTTLSDASLPRTARERARAEVLAELKEIGRRHLAESGSAALSLRAVARQAGMVSSAVYRYFPSRDELLTALIVDAYNALGAEVERADAGRRRSDIAGRWMALCRAVRRWALANSHEYALIFGSPVPGYHAPQDTVDPASRTTLTLVSLLHDGIECDAITNTGGVVPGTVRKDLIGLNSFSGVDIPAAVMLRGLAAWTQLFGHVSFELFGQFTNLINDRDSFFEVQMKLIGQHVIRG